jgi:hypothetical protein
LPGQLKKTEGLKGAPGLAVQLSGAKDFDELTGLMATERAKELACLFDKVAPLSHLGRIGTHGIMLPVVATS